MAAVLAPTCSASTVFIAEVIDFFLSHHLAIYDLEFNV